MAPERRAVQDNPKEALAEYILELQVDYYAWYKAAASRNYWTWAIAQGAAVVAGLATAAIAGLANEELFRSYSGLRVLLIVLPLLGTFASTFLLQTRVRDLLALRERGRQAIQAIVTSARVEFAAANTPERLTTIHRDLAERVRKIEEEQTVGFFAAVPDLTPLQKADHTIAPVE